PSSDVAKRDLHSFPTRRSSDLGMNLNIFNNHADRVKMANLAQIVNVLQAVILTEGEKMILTPTYHVMKMYNVHQDAQLIPIELKDRKSTRLNSSHVKISYAVFC